MAAVAFAAMILSLLSYRGSVVFLALGLGGLVLAFKCWAGKSQKAPSTEFLRTLIGMFLGGVLLTPAKVNVRPTNDFRDFADILGIIGGATAGAVVGAVVAWADRRMVSRQQRPS
jgi:hypothetical protein